MNEEDQKTQADPLAGIVDSLAGDPKYQELKKALMVNYVYMACFSQNSNQMAFNEGMREMAAMICGVNEEVRQWLEKAQQSG